MEVKHVGMEVDKITMEAISALAAMAVDYGVPAAPDDDEPEFQQRIQRAITLSLEESRYHVYLCHEDDCQLRIGFERNPSRLPRPSGTCLGIDIGLYGGIHGVRDGRGSGRLRPRGRQTHGQLRQWPPHYAKVHAIV